MWTAASPLTLDDKQAATLEQWLRAASTPQAIATRCRIILSAAKGQSNSRIAQTLGISRPTVIQWRERFRAGGPIALTEVATGRGRKASLSPKKVKQIVEATLHTKPAGATHWSCRLMAKEQRVSPATVQRIWDAHGLQPHRTKSFKLSRDKQFVEKLTDVVGLYLNPPDKALVLCVDEKTQIQALDRTQPGLPMKKGRLGTVTHDYRRHGTTCLFAALNTVEGTVIGSCYARHRNIEFLKFLRTIDRQTPAGLDLHLILDNYGTHKHPKVQQWLRRHSRFHLHFTPTSSSWLNLVERWFGEITRQRIRRGVFHSVPELVTAIEEYIQLNNQDPKPFVWTKKADEILAKVNHCKAIAETLH